MKNIAIYGGSFDPPHKGHEKVVKEALKTLDLDRLFIVPTYINPFKKEFFAPPKLRSRWSKKIWGKNSKISICKYEIKRKKPTPTYLTYKHLVKKYKPKKVYIIIGADNISSLSRWYKYKKLKSRVEFVVATRDGGFVPKDLQKLKINVNISSTLLRQNPKKRFISKKIFKSVKDFYTKKGRKWKKNCKK